MGRAAHSDAPGRVVAWLAVIQYTRVPTGTPSPSPDDAPLRATRAATSRPPLSRRRPRTRAACPPRPAEAAPGIHSGLAGEDHQPDEHQHDGQTRGRGQVADTELGEDGGGEGVEVDDLEGAVFGQQGQAHDQAAAGQGGSHLAQGDPGEGGDRAQTEAAGDLLLGTVGPPQGRRDRDVHQRVEPERHDQGGARQPLDGRGDRMPGVAHHEIGNGDRQDDQDRPDPPPGSSPVRGGRPRPCR